MTKDNGRGKTAPGIATREQRNQRLLVCTQCEHLRKDFNQCSLCGCFVLAKTWAKSSACPDRRW